MRTSALFGAKNFGFFEIYVSARTRGVEPVRTRGRGQFFAICADVFYDGLTS